VRSELIHHVNQVEVGSIHPLVRAMHAQHVVSLAPHPAEARKNRSHAVASKPQPVNTLDGNLPIDRDVHVVRSTDPTNRLAGRESRRGRPVGRALVPWRANLLLAEELLCRDDVALREKQAAASEARLPRELQHLHRERQGLHAKDGGADPGMTEREQTAGSEAERREVTLARTVLVAGHSLGDDQTNTVALA